MSCGTHPSGDVLVLLAGGEARRLPGKAERLVDGVPLVVRQYRRFAPHAEVVVSLARSLSAEVMSQLTCTLIFDRYRNNGPLGAMLSCCEVLDAEAILFLAVDMPLVTTSALEMLRDARRAGDEAVLAVHDGRVEPLVALYDRTALLREGLPLLERGEVAVHRVAQRLRARYVSLPAEQLANLNTGEDWKAIFGSRSAHDLDR